jgi:hypothetical protein
MPSESLYGHHVVIELAEKVEAQPDKSETNWHVKDGTYPVAGLVHGSKGFCVVGGVQSALGYHRGEHDSTASLVEAEQEKWLKIVVSDTISDPRTMVVHF